MDEQQYFEQFVGESTNNHELLGERTALDAMKDTELWQAVGDGIVRVTSKLRQKEISSISKHAYYVNELVIHHKLGSPSEVNPRFTVIVEQVNHSA